MTILRMHFTIQVEIDARMRGVASLQPAAPSAVMQRDTRVNDHLFAHINTISSKQRETRSEILLCVTRSEFWPCRYHYAGILSSIMLNS